MRFDSKLSGKILDPIHGTIMITDVEREIIGHLLFQRLRNVKQNTFLYKVFPSAMHSRFEHSLGVMHVAYKMYRHLVINSYRYNSKYHDKLLFSEIENITDERIQELRLAALLHDIGHGPMSHQFDSFLLSKSQLMAKLGPEFDDIYELIDGEDDVEHEHMSLIFIKKIFSDLNVSVNVDNVIKLIESKYKGGTVFDKISGSNYNIQPLFTSLISSCPIDSDRMDYLLRDSYFSGVKCGIYNVERILMSIVPVIEESDICLAYKESCLDSISEFVFSRSSLFSQVYYHKTNRAFSAMLSKVCKYALADESYSEKLYELIDDDYHRNLILLEKFYLDNSDDEFINETVPFLIQNNLLAESMVDDIVKRTPWKKLFEAKYYDSNVSVSTVVNKNFTKALENEFTGELSKVLDEESFIVDIMTDNVFKDLDKTSIKLLTKANDGSYDSRDIGSCGEKLDMYQCIRYFVRVFVEPDRYTDEVKKTVVALDGIKESLVSTYFDN